MEASEAVLPIIRWYFTRIYGQLEGPGAIPFYCDPSKVGQFALRPNDLINQNEGALFRLFVGMAMFQARRDVVIMQRQLTMPRSSVQTLASSAFIGRTITASACSKLRSADVFDRGCDVAKEGTNIDCRVRPGAPCHVKDSTVAFNRMGDMGKLPTSAWLHLRQGFGLRAMVSTIASEYEGPVRRATILVERLRQVHRVGRKLATMFVGALSTPYLAPGLTPWFPVLDGNELVVVDTNVAAAIAGLGGPRANSYDACERWIRERAATIDLQSICPDVPSYSPRLLQQALYRFCSKSNRVASHDPCVGRQAPCRTCAPEVCPFVADRL
jgi:hypothetical protein